MQAISDALIFNFNDHHKSCEASKDGMILSKIKAREQEQIVIVLA